MIPSSEILFRLLRAAVGNEDVGELPSDIDWREVIDLSFDQGVAAIAVDGLHRLCELHPEMDLSLNSMQLRDLKYEWFGELFSCEEDYRSYVDAINSLVRTYSDNGVETVILKGYGLSLNYPVPAHRIVGDIDVFLSDWRKGDAIIGAKGIRIDYSHHHHSVFKWKGFTVENHYDIENRYASKAGRMKDDLLKGMAMENRKEREGACFPSACFNGIFLTSHAASHFAGDHITLRHLMDWALFVDKDWQEIDWPLVVDTLKRFGLLRFLSCMNALSVDCLGISPGKFPVLERDAKLEKRVLEDILHPTFSEKGSGFLFKLRRLKANMWKRNLVASEALLPRLLRLAWSHMIKPADKLQ